MQKTKRVRKSVYISEALLKDFEKMEIVKQAGFSFAVQYLIMEQVQQEYEYGRIKKDVN